MDASAKLAGVRQELLASKEDTEKIQAAMRQTEHLMAEGHSSRVT